MKLYATITSERDSRAAKKGGNERLRVELSAFNRIVGYIVLEITDDNTGAQVQYLLKFAPTLNGTDWVILKAGRQKEGAL